MVYAGEPLPDERKQPIIAGGDDELVRGIGFSDKNMQELHKGVCVEIVEVGDRVVHQKWGKGRPGLG